MEESEAVRKCLKPVMQLKQLRARQEEHIRNVWLREAKENHMSFSPLKGSSWLFALAMGILALLMVMVVTAHAEEYSDEEIVEAIYKAEGGDNAQYPYGIRSVKCSTKAECKRICTNTVKNNLKRYAQYGHRRYSNYLEFLASRYAPVGVENDPQGLNQNWLRNVRYFLARNNGKH